MRVSLFNILVPLLRDITVEAMNVYYLSRYYRCASDETRGVFLSEMEEGLAAANAKLEATEKAIGRGAPKAEQDPVAAERDGALFNAEVHKRVKKVLGKVYKRLQSDFAGDQMMHSGKEVRELLANSIREMASLIEVSDGRSDGSQGEAPVTTPVALVNPIHNDVSDKNPEAATF